MGYRARSAIGSQWSIPLRLIDGRPMPPLPPPQQVASGAPTDKATGIGNGSGETAKIKSLERM